MTESIYTRTEMLLGSDAMAKLRGSTVAVFGVGGVGSYAAEALVRSGVGRILLIDGDCVVPSNLNRQLIADQSTLGMPKSEAAAARLRLVNPDADIIPVQIFYTPENSDKLDLTGVDCVIDAIDTVTSKIHLICLADNLKIPVISSMGAGGKLDPSMLKAADIYETKVCPLARVMRRELRARGVKSLKVVYSEESPYTPPEGTVKGSAAKSAQDCTCAENGALTEKKAIPSMAFVPGAAGLIMASEAVRLLCGI